MPKWDAETTERLRKRVKQVTYEQFVSCLHKSEMSHGVFTAVDMHRLCELYELEPNKANQMILGHLFTETLKEVATQANGVQLKSVQTVAVPGGANPFDCLSDSTIKDIPQAG